MSESVLRQRKQFVLLASYVGIRFYQSRCSGNRCVGLSSLVCSHGGAVLSGCAGGKLMYFSAAIRRSFKHQMAEYYIKALVILDTDICAKSSLPWIEAEAIDAGVHCTETKVLLHMIDPSPFLDHRTQSSHRSMSSMTLENLSLVSVKKTAVHMDSFQVCIIRRSLITRTLIDQIPVFHH